MGSLVASGAPGAPLASSISLEKADHLLWLAAPDQFVPTDASAVTALLASKSTERSE